MGKIKNRTFSGLAKWVGKEYPNEQSKILCRADEILIDIQAANPNEAKAVAIHTRQIYATIAIYKAVAECTANRERAYRMVSRYYESMAYPTREALRALFKIPALYKCIPKLMNKIIRFGFGEKSGFQMQAGVCEKNKCHIDMLQCPYFENCKKYGCEELTTAFCNSDDIGYGNMHPKAKWLRTKTLGRGDECCNFIVEIEN